MASSSDEIPTNALGQLRCRWRAVCPQCLNSLADWEFQSFRRSLRLVDESPQVAKLQRREREIVCVSGEA